MDEEALAAVDLWGRCRDREIVGMAAGLVPGPLPESGGVLDQAACTLESLAVIDAAWRLLRPAEKPPVSRRRRGDDDS